MGKSYSSSNEGFPLIKLADIIGAILSDNSYGERMIFSIAPLIFASEGDISYILSRKFINNVDICQASAILCNLDILPFIPKSIPCLLSDKPHISLAILGSILYPQDIRIRPITRFIEGISSKASISKNVKFEDNVIIDSMAVISSGVEIGSHTYIGPGSFIGLGVKIGRYCNIGAGVTVVSAFIGNNVVVNPGVKIGSNDFVCIMDNVLSVDDTVDLGRVVIQDNVEIGVNTIIHRGKIDNTIIGENSKIGNQVQIRRNVYIGIGCIIANKVGIGISAFIGDNVFIESQCAIADYINIEDNVRITIKDLSME
ncbi:UDP-3-O-(3-hydroxymyristoyl)glucosamine N-acyltransferase [Candidatus Liberibacter americanus]|uniref:UDP-3-O-(3-hydroxymyristoyl)glucosamine N-acyltransferase n=1 Tax=Candidatus Liberibacter americanus TaxID=309868 RepID=UPI0002C5F72F|nr:UDP-3-O-(3-hydroxymyristoyl)glucosamine N-acyltransferase [Candidatus Liberibacter americanus]EMS36476.1 UDP-3-O-[3-hydroxymyristoyl] glucosamine N-acyltransferase [Candidatus Liberibacter americanus PW_SP]